MATKLTRRKVLAKWVEIRKMKEGPAKQEAFKAFGLEMIENMPQDMRGDAIKDMLTLVLAPMSIEDRHTFLNDLYKQSLN